MKQGIKRLIIGSALVFAAASAMATPAYLITHNKTNVQSNAYIAGIPSPHPTSANSDSKIPWIAVRMVCFGHTDNGVCKATIKMETNTNSPIELGVVSMDLASGDIMPKTLTTNGYTLTVNGPGETTLTKE